METKLLTDDISYASDIIKCGGLVAVPTETVYGLAANGLNEAAVKKIYTLKGRPETKPLSLMVAGEEAMDELCEDVPKIARLLAHVFWPGPLTIVLKAKAHIPSCVLAGGTTVGLRCPDHKSTLKLLSSCGCPLAAPSANPSDEKSPVNANEVLNYFDGKLEAIIDGGECRLGKESTIIDMSAKPYKILRQGAVNEEDLTFLFDKDLTVIGLTGGTGCGKTTALNVIKDMGGLVLDCDEIYHKLLAENKNMRGEINERFPGAIPEGSGDTKGLGRIVFNNKEALLALNAITHRYVFNEVCSEIYRWAKQGGTLVAIDAIALVESGISRLCDKTVGVIAPTKMRVERLMAREDISEEYATLRVNAQKSNEYFDEICDYTVSNDSTVESFELKCKNIFNEIIGGKNE